MELWSRFTPHFTPKHGSWLNQAETEVSLLSRTCLGRNRLGGIAALNPRVAAWNQRMNRQVVRIDWRFTVRDARRKFGYGRWRNGTFRLNGRED